jgi:hypothetical protein
VLDWTMLYGYAAWRSLLLGVVLIAMGWWVFASAESDRAMAAATEAPPPFNGFVYSLDSFLPIVDFGQETSWTPREGATFELAGRQMSAAWAQRYLWLHIALGWLVTTLAVAALSGLVRRG